MNTSTTRIAPPPETAPGAGSPACWICGERPTVVWKPRNLQRELRPEDFQITDRHYGVTLQLRRCGACGFIFADDREILDLLGLYEDLVDPQYEGTQTSRLLQMQWLLHKVCQARPAAQSLLDVGAGAGLLVAEAGRRGLQATGVEPSRALVDAAQRANGVQLINGVFPHPELAGRKFDLICLVDVIEHVSQPLELLCDCRHALSDQGLLGVVTPDVASVAARVLGQRWWHFRLAHVGYFDSRTLELAGRRCGLQVERQFRAKWFFPVHYLAERVASYLPLAWWNRLAMRVAPLRWLYQRVIPLDLRDSFVVFYRPGKSQDR